MSGIFAIIPARGGSKGIRGKNIRPIAGKPLISWTIEAALACERLDRVVVTTDDRAIAEFAIMAGAEVPFIRPAELAADDTPGVLPVLHAVSCLPDADAVVVLQPTSPLRVADDIDGVLDLAERERADSIVTVSATADHPCWTFRLAGGRLEPFLDGERAARRQDLEPAYALNGSIYFSRRGWLETRRTLVGPETYAFITPIERSVDIDTEFDWKVAEMLLAERNIPLDGGEQ